MTLNLNNPMFKTVGILYAVKSAVCISSAERQYICDAMHILLDGRSLGARQCQVINNINVRVQEEIGLCN